MHKPMKILIPWIRFEKYISIFVCVFFLYSHLDIEFVLLSGRPERKKPRIIRNWNWTRTKIPEWIERIVSSQNQINAFQFMHVWVTRWTCSMVMWNSLHLTISLEIDFNGRFAENHVYVERTSKLKMVFTIVDALFSIFRLSLLFRPETEHAFHISNQLYTWQSSLLLMMYHGFSPYLFHPQPTEHLLNGSNRKL